MHKKVPLRVLRTPETAKAENPRKIVYNFILL